MEQLKLKISLKLFIYSLLVSLCLINISNNIEAADLGPIRSGETLSSSIDPVGDIDTFTFYGEEGETVIINMSKTNGSFWFSEYIELYDPEGYLEKSEYDSISNYKLLKSGVYTIVCRESRNDDTGNYNISFIKIPGPFLSPEDRDGGDIISGDIKEGEINLASDIDGFNFYGEKDETVIINVSNTNGSFWFSEYIELYDPEGYLEKSEYDSISNYKLLKTGLYTVICRDSRNDSTGKYNLSFTKLPSTLPPGIYQPKPENGERVLYTTNIIEWASTEWADKYDVYFGTNVLEPLERVREDITENYYFLPTLNVGNTYYWKIVAKKETGEEKPGPVWMFTTNFPPTIELSETSLLFIWVKGEPDLPVQTFKIRNSGVDEINYEIGSSKSWLNVSPQTGKSTDEWDTIDVSVNISGLEEGTYKGILTITSTEASNSPQKVNVELNILLNIPYIQLDKTSLLFIWVKGEPEPPLQTFKIRNAAVDEINYEINSNKSWLNVSPQTGKSAGEWDTIDVSVNISGFTEGTYEGILTVTSTEASNSPQKINVELNILSNIPYIQLDKTSLSFSGTKGRLNPPAQAFQIKNGEGGKLEYLISADKNWIKVSPQSGTSQGEWDTITISVESSGLDKGEYEGSINITSGNASNSPQKIKIILTVILPPLIELSTNLLSFEGVEGGSNPESKTFKIKNSGDKILNYKIEADQDWISVSPEEGSSSGEWDEIEVSVDISSFSEGQYSGKVKVSSADADNSPQEVEVSLKVKIPPIFPPINFSGAKIENRWIFKIEYINVLSWAANPFNKNINKYRIYLKEGYQLNLLVEVNSNTFEYYHRDVEKEKEYIYALVAVDYKDREGEPAYITVR